MEMNLHLEEYKSVPELSHVAGILQSEHKRRFRKYTDPSDADHDPIFLLATMLDPRYKLILNRVQMDRAKEVLLQNLKDTPESSSTNSSPDL